MLVPTRTELHPRLTRENTSPRSSARPGRSLVGSLLSVTLGLAVLLGGGAPASAALPTPRPPVALTTAPESPSPYQGQVSCDPVEKPGVTAIRAMLKTTYGTANSGGSARACSSGGTSEHKEGRAYDWMLSVYTPSQKAMGDAFVAWLTGPDAQGVAGGNAHRLGVQYVIWNKRTWQSWRGAWKDYTGASPHTDHVHISLSWDGAFKRTSWYTGKALTARDYGPCAVYIGETAPAYTAPNYSPCPDPVPRAYRTVTGDFDGDGRTDVGTYYDGRFHLRIGGSVREVAFGSPGDVPVAGDWDGDGRDGIGVFRNGAWYLRNSIWDTTVHHRFTFGGKGYRAVAGDWDGDGKDSVAVHGGGTWYVRATTAGTSARTSLVWGSATDLPVAGDWDGDGKDGIGLFRTGYGWWMLAATTVKGSPVTRVRFGPATALPTVGDFDGDGRTTVGAARLATHTWTNSPTGADPRTSSLPF